MIFTGRVRTTCAYCGVGCGIVAEVNKDQSVSISGDQEHPANFGRLCTKGTTLGETFDLTNRLLVPKVEGAPSDWDSALSTVAARFARTVAEHGPDSVAFYVSGQLLTEDYYVANKLMKGFIGSSNIDTNSRLCMASSVAGHKRAFGEDVVPGVYEDLELADLIILVGSNLAWCHPILHQRILAAREAREIKLVVIDPRETVTSQGADLHLDLNPGSDVALFNGLLRDVLLSGADDGGFLAEHVSGLSAARRTAADFDIATVAAQTGLPRDKVATFYEWFIQNPRTVTVYSQGVNQSSAGSDKVNSIINCHLATGRIGQPGTGPFSVTGQPNAMGGREVGGLANMLAAHIDFDDRLGHQAVADFWNAPRLSAKPGLKAVDMFDAIEEGRIKALWIMATNPAVSLPEADRVRRAIERCPFTVVSDIVKRTDSSRSANVLLPALGWGEKDGTVTNSERCISRQRAFREPPGQARADWWIISEVAARMGFAEAFSYQSASEVFAEYAALTSVASERPRCLDLTAFAGIDAHGYDALLPQRWPQRAVADIRESHRLFGNGGFSTADGRAKMIATPLRLPASQSSYNYPYIVNSGRIRDQWHTMTRTAEAAQLSAHYGEPFVEMHPMTAAEIGVEAGELVVVENNSGEVILRALVTDRQRPGRLFVPMHWSDEFASAGRVNKLFAANVDPVSGQPELKFSPVSARRFAAKWFGFAVTVAGWNPATTYWARMKTANGCRLELADTESIDEASALFEALLPASASVEIVSYLDTASDSYRFAAMDNGALVAALFVAPRPVVVSRTFVADALGSEVAAAAVLAGRAAGERVDDGALICSCHGIGSKTIQRAIIDGADDLAAVGACTRAGTNCGSCRPEIQQLINAVSVAEAS
ncbi:MAG: nitrate reductase [Pseudomonadota bacterium]